MRLGYVCVHEAVAPFFEVVDEYRPRRFSINAKRATALIIVISIGKIEGVLTALDLSRNITVPAYRSR